MFIPLHAMPFSYELLLCYSDEVFVFLLIHLRIYDKIFETEEQTERVCKALFLMFFVLRVHCCCDILTVSEGYLKKMSFLYAGFSHSLVKK